MKTYFVRLLGQSALSLPTPLRVEFPGMIIVADNWLNPTDAGLPPQHLGLAYTVTLEADTLQMATSRAAAELRPVLDLIATVHGTSLPDPMPWLTFDLDSDTADREFGQFIPDLPSTVRPNRRFSHAHFGEVLARLNDVADPDHEMTISRALHAFRRSIHEAVPSDQFLELWTGLEAINSVLQFKYGLPTKQILRTCKVCQAPVEGPVSSGIKHIIVVLLNQEEEVWRRIRDTRNALVHTSVKNRHFLNDATELVLVLRDALLVGILDVLNVDPLLWNGIRRPPLQIGTGPMLYLEARLHGYTVANLLENPELPYLQLTDAQHSIEGHPVSGDGQVQTGTYSFLIQNFVGTYTVERIEALFPRDPEDTKGGVEFQAS